MEHCYIIMAPNDDIARSPALWDYAIMIDQKSPRLEPSGM